MVSRGRTQFAPTVLYRFFVRANPPINQNLKDKLVFIGVLKLFLLRLPLWGRGTVATVDEEIEFRAD